MCIRSVNHAEGQSCLELSLGGWPRRYRVSHRCSRQTKHSRGHPRQHPAGGSIPVVLPRRASIVPYCSFDAISHLEFPAVMWCIYMYFLLCSATPAHSATPPALLYCLTLSASRSASTTNCDVLFSMGFRVSAITIACIACLLYTSPSPRDKRQSRMPSSA